MPPQLLFDISGLDLTKILFDKEEIRRVNPQRGHMEMLDGIVYSDNDPGRLIGYKDIGQNEFWADGHIPGRPLLPGVMMIECGAQLASFYTAKFVGWKGFIGFGGLEDCKFRGQVVPGDRFYILGLNLWQRHGRICCRVQGLVKSSLVFEASIIGVKM
jgi:3-hydroxyacyl-[acyl-carrier-protein] dehydratase